MPSTTDFIATITPASSIDQWMTATAYTLDQYVEAGTKLYRCVLAHTSSALFATDLSTKWVEVSPSNPVATLLDSSGVAVTETLPAATGSGATRIYAIKDKTNSITFAVQAGDYLNEVINATYLASNHGVGTEFELVDYATDKWALSIVGAPTSRSLARYSVRGVAANISTVNGPNILPIGSLINSDLTSSGMSLASEHDPLGWRTANQVTVSKTGRYRVDVSVVHTAANLSGTDAQTASGSSRSGIRINGTSIEWTGIDDTAGLADQTSGFIVRQFTAGDQIDVVINATSIEVNEDFYVSFAMEELPTTEVILAGMVVPTPLVFSHARAATSQAVADSANVLISLDTAVSDTAGLFVSGTNRIVIASNGLYRIRGVIPWSSSGNPGIQSATILVSGVAVKSSSTRNNQPLAVTEVEITLLLVAGDYVQLRARQETGVALTTTIAATNLANVYPELEVRQLPLSTVVNPDTVPVTSLAWGQNYWSAFGTLSNAASVLSTVATGSRSTLAPAAQRLPMIGTTTPTSGVFTGSGVTRDTVNNQFQITVAGRYSVSADVFGGPSGITQSALQLIKNGVSIIAMSASGNTEAYSPLHLAWEGDLAVSDTLELRAWTLGAGNYYHDGGTFIVEQQPSHSIVKYNPGDVVVEDLHWISLSNVTAGNGTEVTTKGGFVELSVAAITKRNPYNLLVTNAAGDYIEIKQAGRYAIDMAIALSGPINASLTVNGAVVATSVSSAANYAAVLNYTGDFVVGDQIRITSTATAGRFSMSVNQQATGVLVDPGTVPVNTIGRFSSRDQATTFGTGIQAVAVVASTNPQTVVTGTQRVTVSANQSGNMLLSANSVIIPAAGDYTISANVLVAVAGTGPTNFIQMTRNGTSLLAMTGADAANGDKQPLAVSYTGSFSANDLVDIRLGSSSASTINVFAYNMNVVQVPTATVINPGTVPVITDATLATGTNANVASALATKTYVDSRTAIPVVQTFTTSGTYTPTTGMKYCVVEAVGGGGGGGSTSAGSATTLSVGAGGGGGAEARVMLTAAQVGASAVVTIGTGGAAAAAGTATSVGALLTANGGSAGGSTGAQVGPHAAAGGVGGAITVTTGTVIASKAGTIGTGASGMYYATTTLVTAVSASGASTSYGAGGAGVSMFNPGSGAQGAVGGNGQGFGSGGGGASTGGAGSVARTGGSGAPGRVVITEYF